MALPTGELLSGGQVSDVNGRQVVAIDNTDVGSGGGISVVNSSANALGANAKTATAGSSAALVPANASRKGIQVVVDPAATAVVYFLLGAGTASAANFHFGLSAGASWDGLVGSVLWTGAVQFFSSGTPVVGVAEV